VLPVPFGRTTSYVPGTKNGPREIIAASGQVELYDEELGREIADIGIHTLPGMESPFASTDDALPRGRFIAVRHRLHENERQFNTGQGASQGEGDGDSRCPSTLARLPWEERSAKL